MEVFLARQPIFDRAVRVYGYELLYRSGAVGGFDGTDGTLASLQVLSNSLLGFGLTKLLGNRPGFVNFPRSLLVSDVGCALPPQSIVIEILESVHPDAEVIASCRKLKEAGYVLALDDVDPTTSSLALAEFASIIKVDWRATDAAGRKALVRRYGQAGIRMLAEKVETQEEFTQASRDGFDLFQGYFFTRPVILSRKEIPALKMNYLRLLSEVNCPEIAFDHIERLVKQEASLCQRLLRYVNSAAFSRRAPVASIPEALAFLGETGLRRWVSLSALPALASDKPAEVVESAVLRARFCELIAPHSGMRSRSAELFLLGMFSLLDVMVGRPLAEILEELRLSGDIIDALAGQPAEDNMPALVYRLVLAFEKGDWPATASLAGKLEVPAETAAALYLEAVDWCASIFHGEPHVRR